MTFRPTTSYRPIQSALHYPDEAAIRAMRQVRRRRSVRLILVSVIGAAAAMSAPAYGQSSDKGDFTEYARQYCEADAYKNRMPDAVDTWMVAAMGDQWIYGEPARAKTNYEKSQEKIKAQIKALQDNTNRAYGMPTTPDEPASDMIERTPRKRYAKVLQSRLKSFIPWEEVVCTATVQFTFTPIGSKERVYEFRDLDYRIRGDTDGRQTWVEAYHWPDYTSDAFATALLMDGITLKAVIAQRQADRAAIDAMNDAAAAKQAAETARRAPACEAAGGTWGYKETRDRFGNWTRSNEPGCYFQTVGG